MELIKIDVNAEQEAVVSGRELHKALEIGTQYTKWFERMREYGFLENQDFATVSQKCLIANGGYQEKVDHAIKIDMAKEIAMIQRSEKGKQVRQYFIECENKLKLNTTQLSPQLQAFNQIFQAMANVELEQKETRRIAQRAEEAVLQTKEEFKDVRDIISLDTNSWRTDGKAIVIKIAQSLGGNEYIRDVNNEIYTLLNMRMGVNLEQRLTNKRRRMADEGICKSKRKKTSKLDVIAEDKKPIEGYVAIVKEMAVNYHVPKIVDDPWREE